MTAYALALVEIDGDAEALRLATVIGFANPDHAVLHYGVQPPYSDRTHGICGTRQDSDAVGIWDDGEEIPTDMFEICPTCYGVLELFGELAETLTLLGDTTVGRG